MAEAGRVCMRPVTGSLTVINGNGGVDLGDHVFGIGYDAGLNKLGFGRFDGSTMSFHTYDFATDQIDDHAGFPFDSAQYGTPTGLDYVNHNGNWRMLVSTKNGPKEMPWDPSQNFILDMDAETGEVGKFKNFDGNSLKLEDLSYNSGRLASVYEEGSTGLVQVDDFTPFTRPKIEQNILFPVLPSKTYGDAPFMPEASADSDLPLVFQCLPALSGVEGETSVATVSNGWITTRSREAG